jgi:glycosyltransferase involved in cell wall biosynthesis
MRFSIVTPTFQRRQLVRRAIESALAFTRTVDGSELVVVDDASTDGTFEELSTAYRREIDRGLMVLVRRPLNGGVAAAKNEGVRAAGGEWVVFLDSDDRLLPAATNAIPALAARYPAAPILFFRCENENGHLIGPPVTECALDLSGLLANGTPGECLPVAARSAILAFPYDEDLPAFEILAYLRMVQALGPAAVSVAIARSYATSGADRITTLAARLRRAERMALGFSRFLSEFDHELPLRQRFALRARVFVYGSVARLGIARPR